MNMLRNEKCCPEDDAEMLEAIRSAGASIVVLPDQYGGYTAVVEERGVINEFKGHAAEYGAICAAWRWFENKSQVTAI